MHTTCHLHTGVPQSVCCTGAERARAPTRDNNRCPPSPFSSDPIPSDPIYFPLVILYFPPLLLPFSPLARTINPSYITISPVPGSGGLETGTTTRTRIPLQGITAHLPSSTRTAFCFFILPDRVDAATARFGVQYWLTPLQLPASANPSHRGEVHPHTSLGGAVLDQHHHLQHPSQSNIPIPFQSSNSHGKRYYPVIQLSTAAPPPARPRQPGIGSSSPRSTTERALCS